MSIDKAKYQLTYAEMEALCGLIREYLENLGIGFGPHEGAGVACSHCTANHTVCFCREYIENSIFTKMQIEIDSMLRKLK